MLSSLLKPLFERVKTVNRALSSTTQSLKSAIDKYNTSINDPYNFLDINNNIRMHEELIRFEDNRLIGRRRQTAILLTIFGILFVYFPQIVTFIFQRQNEWWVLSIFSLYFIGIIASVICFILHIWPANIPQQISPSIFFNEDLNNYKDEGLDDEEANIGVKHSYLRNLEKSLELLQNANKWKGFWHFWCIICLSVTFVFYFASSTIVIVSNKIDNREIVNKTKNNMGEEKKKKFDPSKTHDVPPQVIREGKEIKFINTSKKDSTKK